MSVNFALLLKAPAHIQDILCNAVYITCVCTMRQAVLDNNLSNKQASGSQAAHDNNLSNKFAKSGLPGRRATHDEKPRLMDCTDGRTTVRGSQLLADVSICTHCTVNTSQTDNCDVKDFFKVKNQTFMDH